MCKKETIIETIRKMGYHPEQKEEDNLITFRYQLKTILVVADPDDESFFLVMLPRFHHLEEGTELQVLATCNQLTRGMKMIKVFVERDHEDVTASCEFIADDERALEQNLQRALDVLGSIRRVFRHDLQELL